MIEVIPAILAENQEDLDEKISLLNGRVRWAHFDVLPDTPAVSHFNTTPKFEAHFMTLKPEESLDAWISAGVDRIIIHNPTPEILEHRMMFEVGLAVEFHIPIEEILHIVPQVDFVQLMAIAEIGKQGNKFEAGIFDRIKELRSAYPGVLISVDGGVSLDNADELIAAGAERLIVGSAIWQDLVPMKALEDFLILSKNHAH